MRQALVLGYAEEITGPYVLGTMVQTKEHFSGFGYYYSFEDMWNDTIIGTRVDIFCGPDGSFMYASSNIGSVYERKWNGTIGLIRSDPLIGEEAATKLAYKALDHYTTYNTAAMSAADFTLRLVAWGPTLYYEATFVMESDDCHSHIFEIDPYTGEILEHLACA